MIGGRWGGLAPIIPVFVLHNMQTNMTRPYVPLYAASLDAGYLGVGIVAAAVGFLPVFFALPVGNIVDRLGPRPLIMVGSLCNVTSMLLLWSVPHLAVVIVCQMITGFAHLMIALSAQAYIGSLGKGRAAERNFGTFTVFASIGQIGGPLLGGVLIGLFGFGGVFLAGATLSLLCFVAVLTLLSGRRPLVDPQSARPASARRALEYLRSRDTQLAILASCLMGVPEILRTSFLPLYLGEVVRLDTALLGYVLAIFSVAGLVAKSVLPRLVARFGRQIMLFSFTVGCALALAAMPLTASLWVVAIITACMGLTFGLGRPLSMAMASNSSRSGEEGFVIALRLSGNRVVDFVLPVIFGGAASVAGIGAVFVSGGLIMLLGAAALVSPMINEIRARRRGETEEPGEPGVIED